MIRAKIYLTTVFLFFMGCTNLCERAHKDLSPTEVVEAYLNIAFNMESLEDRDKLLTLTTGPLKESIAKSSDKTIIDAYISRKYKLKSYSVVERKDRTPRETEITFEVIYVEGEDGSNPQITTENTISVIKKKSLWLLNDVLNKRSSFDFPVTDAEVRPSNK